MVELDQGSSRGGNEKRQIQRKFEGRPYQWIGDRKGRDKDQVLFHCCGLSSTLEKTL